MAYRLNSIKEKAVVDWVKACILTAYPTATVFWDKQSAGGAVNNKLPAYPFVVLNIIAGPFKDDGHSDRKYKKNKAGTPTDTYTFTFRKRVTVSINVFAAENHLDIVSKIQNGVELPTKLDILNSKGIVIRGATAPSDISELLDSKYEMRATMDIELAYAETVDDTITEVREVQYEKTNAPEFEGDIKEA